MFTWVNAQGEPWSKVLKANARKEFEQARYESDRLIITRLLFVGRDCLNQTTDKLLQASNAIKDKIDKSRTS